MSLRSGSQRRNGRSLRIPSPRFGGRRMSACREMQVHLMRSTTRTRPSCAMRLCLESRIGAERIESSDANSCSRTDSTDTEMGWSHQALTKRMPTPPVTLQDSVSIAGHRVVDCALENWPSCTDKQDCTTRQEGSTRGSSSSAACNRDVMVREEMSNKRRSN